MADTVVPEEGFVAIAQRLAADAAECRNVCLAEPNCAASFLKFGSSMCNLLGASYAKTDSDYSTKWRAANGRVEVAAISSGFIECGNP